MRAIFMIPSKPPPSFSKPDRWSAQFIDFVSRCLVKNPDERATASQLLQHEFIGQRELSPGRLLDMINEAQQMRERLAENVASTDNSSSSRTMVGGGGDDEEDSGTLVRHGTAESSGGTMIQHATLVPESQQQQQQQSTLTQTTGNAARTLTDVESYLSTMVINEDDNEDDDTMKREA